MAHDVENDGWELGTGLPLAGATVEVTNAEFIIDNDYAAGAVVLALHLLDEEGETRKQLYSMGKKAEIIEKGAAVELPGKINVNSNYGRWIAAAVEAGAADVLRDRGNPRQASIWIGCKFVLGELEYTDMGGKDKTLIIPVEFLGVEGEAPKAAKGGTKASKPAAKAEPAKGAKAAKGGDLDAAVEAKIRKIAAKVHAEGGDHAAFVDAATDDEAIVGDRAAMKAVMNQAGIWSEVAGGE